MLRHVLRRLLWTLPTLVGVTLLSFFCLSFIPDLTDDPDLAARVGADEVLRLRRERFLDLPRFVNLAPRDARTRALAAVEAIVEGGEQAEAAKRELGRLGGAALPFVLPTLDSLPPEPRARVAVALAPVAERMGLGASERDDPARAVAFWVRFWFDRGIDFRAPAVRTAVQRLVRYRSTSRAADLRELDTFALPDVFRALEAPRDATSLEAARGLIEVAAHVTGSSDRIAARADLDEAAACVGRWRRWWAVYRSEYAAFAGVSRITAVVLETRYGKWALGAVTERFGLCADGAPVLDELVPRGRTTFAIAFGAILIAYLVAIPLGALSAALRGRRLDLAIAASVLGIFAVPTAVVAVVASRLGGAGGGLVVPTLVLALGLVAAPTRQQRSSLTTALSQDYVRAAIARGAGPVRAIVVHGLRNAVLPVATLAFLEPPLALGGAFVVERVFGLRGLGEATIRAVQSRDLSWLMAISILAAGMAAIAVIVTDLLYVAVDPRLNQAVLSRSAR